MFHQIPNDYGTMVESRNNGVPLLTYAPKAKLTREIEKLSLALDSNSSVVAGGSGGVEVKQKKRLFSFLGK